MKNQLKKLSSLLTVVAMIFALAACSQSKKSNNKAEATSASSKSGNGSQILGAGSTFAYPIYTKMFQVYNKEKGIQVNYQGIGPVVVFASWKVKLSISVVQMLR